MNARKQKTDLFFKKKTQFSKLEEQFYALNAFEFQEQFLIDVFLKKNQTNIRNLDQIVNFRYR